MRVVALALHFSELYQNDEVRSLGEKSRLQPQIPVSGIISGTVHRLKGLSLLGIFRTLDRVQPLSALLDGGGRGPGIEPSPRFPSSPRGPGGQGSKEGDSGQPLAAFRTCLGDRWRQTRKPVRRLPSGCSPHPPKPCGASYRPNWGARAAVECLANYPYS